MTKINYRSAVWMLIAGMAIIAALVTGASVAFLYNTAYEVRLGTLRNTAQALATLIGSVAEFDIKHSAKAHPHGSRGATMEQIRNGLSGSTETGSSEVVVGRKVEDRIEIIHRIEAHGPNRESLMLAATSKLAVPMALALKTRSSGAGQYIDYSGVPVLAGYAYVPALDIAIVRKIDVSEFREPYLQAALWAALVAALTIVLSAVAIRMLVKPLQRRARLQEARIELLAAAVESHNDAIITESPDGIITSWNAGATNLFGHSKADMEGKHISQLLPPDMIGEDETFLARINAGDSIVNLETLRLHKSGKPVEVSLSISPVRNAEGRIVGAAKILRDISERNKAERILEESKTRLAGVVESAMDPIIAINSKRIITLFNQAAEKVFGHTAANIIGQPIERLLPEKYREAHKQHVEKFGMNGTTNRAMGRLGTIFGLRANGEEFPIEASISQVKIDGETNFTVILRDITERSQIEETLRLSEIRLKDAQQLAKVGNWELDLTSGHLHWSDEIFRIFEIDPTLFPASYESFLHAIHPDDRDLVNRSYTESVDNHTRYIINHRICMPDGRIKWVEERGQTFYADDGTPLRSVGTVQDITALHDAEEALQSLNADLEKRVERRTEDLRLANARLEQSMSDLQRAQAQLVLSEKMAALGGLVAGVAHEINTPVGIGVTAASHLHTAVHIANERYRAGQLTRREMDDFLADAAEAAKMVLSNLNRAATLINSFKQVAADQSSGEMRQFKVRAYLGEVLTSLRPALKKALHAVDIQCPDDLQVFSHPGAYSQIITNLVMNSITHGFQRMEAGHIAIRVTPEPEGLLLHYSDDGKGIAPEHLGKIFDPFFTTKRGQGGSGLGLHIVYNLVTQTLGGQIICESTPGKGVTFCIRIPGALAQQDIPAISIPMTVTGG